MKFVWTVITSLVIAFMMALVIPVDAEKYRWESYPWPSYAGKPSREKPMRRDFGEPLEFGEMYPEGGTKPLNAPSRSQTVTKAPSKGKSGHAAAKKGHSTAENRPRDAAPPLPVPRPPWYQRILPTKPVPPPRPLPEMENVDPVPPPPAVAAKDVPETFGPLDFVRVVALVIVAVLFLLGVFVF